MKRIPSALLALVGIAWAVPGAAPAQDQLCLWGMQAQMRIQMQWQRQMWTEQLLANRMQMDMVQQQAIQQRMMAVQSLALIQMRREALRQHPLLAQTEYLQQMTLLARQRALPRWNMLLNAAAARNGYALPPAVLLQRQQWQQLRLLTGMSDLARDNPLKRMTRTAALSKLASPPTPALARMLRPLELQQNRLTVDEMMVRRRMITSACISASVTGVLAGSCRRCHSQPHGFSVEVTNLLIRLPNMPVSWLLRNQVEGPRVQRGRSSGTHAGGRRDDRHYPVLGALLLPPPDWNAPAPPPAGPVNAPMFVPRTFAGAPFMFQQPQPFVWPALALQRPRPGPRAPVAAAAPAARAPVALAPGAAIERTRPTMLHETRPLPRPSMRSAFVTPNNTSSDALADSLTASPTEGAVMQIVVEIARGHSDKYPPTPPEEETSMLPGEARQPPQLPALHAKYAMPILPSAQERPMYKARLKPTLVDIVSMPPLIQPVN